MKGYAKHDAFPKTGFAVCEPSGPTRHKIVLMGTHPQTVKRCFLNHDPIGLLDLFDDCGKKAPETLLVANNRGRRVAFGYWERSHYVVVGGGGLQGAEIASAAHLFLIYKAPRLTSF